MHEAKTHLSRLVRQISDGSEQEIVIAVGGKPAARLLPYAGRGQRNLGIDEGLITISEDFDEVDGTIAALFKGRD